MARPKKNNLDYFPHDNVMRNDKKLKAVRTRFNNEGYAIYNMLLEVISESEMLVIKWNETEIELLSGDFGIESEKLIEIIEYFLKIDLIQKYNGWLYCKQLDKRSLFVFGKRTLDLDSLRIENGIIISEMSVSESKNTQRKVKKSKGKKSKVNKDIENFIPKHFNNEKFINCFNSFTEHRKQIKKPMTDYAKELLIKNLDELSNKNSDIACKIMEQSIFNGWQGVFELKDKTKSKTKTINEIKEQWKKEDEQR